MDCYVECNKRIIVKFLENTPEFDSFGCHVQIGPKQRLKALFRLNLMPMQMRSRIIKG